MDAQESDRKHGSDQDGVKQGKSDADNLQMQFDGLQMPNHAGNGRARRDDRLAPVAFETNSSLASENCSIDSIQVMDNVPVSQGPFYATSQN